MDSRDWDARYRERELVWSAEPNQFLVRETAELPTGRALDVACGEGRNAIWLAGRGWEATGVDFSPVALDKARRISAEHHMSITWIEADLGDWVPAPESFELIIVFYLQVPRDLRRLILRSMVTALAPGGTILIVGHDAQNLVDGYGGPQDPSVLFSVDDLVADLAGLHLVKAEQVRRSVQTDQGERWAIDALVRAVRI